MKDESRSTIEGSGIFAHDALANIMEGNSNNTNSSVYIKCMEVH
jgi:hypothetical protein